MKLFSTARDWFTKLCGRFAATGSTQLVKTLVDVESLAARAMPTVIWIGDVVVAAIRQSHMPVSDVLATEIKKFAPNIPDIERQANWLATKEHADMLLALAVLVLRYSGIGPVKLSILRAAIEIAHLIYSAEKGK